MLAVAGIAAARLPRPRWLTRALDAGAAATPLGWYLLGVLLGPALGLLDRTLLAACTPALACGLGWVAARAGSALRAPVDSNDRPTARDLADPVAALLVPAALLYMAVRFLPPSLAPVWHPIAPAVATLAAAVALAGTTDLRRATILALTAAAGALLIQLPHGSLAGLPRPLAWTVVTLGGAALTALVVDRVGRHAASPLPGAITGVCLGAGIGLATGASPLLLCALAGVALAQWSPRSVTLAAHLATSAPPIATALWVTAGALAEGPFPSVPLAAALLALWPLLRRRPGRRPAAAGETFGLAVALSFTLTVEGGDNTVLTTAALALLLVRAVPAPRRPAAERLTWGARHAEVST